MIVESNTKWDHFSAAKLEKQPSIFQCKQYFVICTLYKVVQQRTIKKIFYKDFFQEMYNYKGLTSTTFRAKSKQLTLKMHKMKLNK